MQEIIENTSSDKLLTSLESNMVAFYSAYGRANGKTLIAESNVVWFYTGVQDPLFNGVLSARLEPDEVKETIANLQTKINEQGVQALWWVGPQSKPDNLVSLLEQSGLQPAGGVPGMAIDLNVIGDKSEPIPNFTIQRVNNVEMQELWARIAALGTGFTDAAVDDLARLEASLNDPQYKAQHRYIGSLNGTPVATSTLVLDSGVAGIYAVATIPEARGKGIGRIMTMMSLLEARQLGYRVGILQSSSMGYSIYQKIGFKEVCSIDFICNPNRIGDDKD